MFRWLRAASPDALEELFFKRAFPNQSTRNVKRMVAALVDEGYLAKMRLPHARLVYHLTRSSLATFAEAGFEVPETLRRPPTAEVGGRSWLLSNLRAELARQAFHVGRGPPAAYALRRFLLGAPGLDRALAAAVRANPMLSPPMTDGCVRCGYRAPFGARRSTCPTCGTGTRPRPLDAWFECVGCKAIAAAPGPHGRCALPMREIDCLPADVAWRKRDGRYDVRLLFVDHPARSLGAQLAELPLRHLGAPRVPVILRSTDPDSRYDRKSHAFAVKGPRHQQLERTFLEDGFDETLPLSKTTTLVEVLPDLQLHIMRSGAAAPAWGCASPWSGGRAKLPGRNKQDREAERQHEQRLDCDRLEPREEEVRLLDVAEIRRALRDLPEVARVECHERPQREEIVPVPPRDPVAAAVSDERGGCRRR